jgi:putative ABC transport system permease protein
VPAVTVPGLLIPGPDDPAPIVSPRVLPPLGLRAVDVGIIVTPTRMPAVGAEDAMRAALRATPGANSALVYVERGDTRQAKGDAVTLLLAVAAAVIALSAAAVATGIAAADSRSDLQTLAAVGAAPRMRRRLSLAQSGIISGLGSLLGTAVGLGAAATILTGLNSVYAEMWPARTPYPIGVPWLNIGIAVVAVPAVAMLGAGLLTRSGLPSERGAHRRGGT